MYWQICHACVGAGGQMIPRVWVGAWGAYARLARVHDLRWSRGLARSALAAGPALPATSETTTTTAASPATSAGDLSSLALRHWRNHANRVTTAHPSRAHPDGAIQHKEDTHVGI
jgi:hypothetical protein